MSKNSQEVCPKIVVGGQAVLEGVMMKGKDHIALAVRRENGDIVVKRDRYTAPSETHKWMGLPIIRGMVNMVLMMKLGMKTMREATDMLGVMDAEPGRFEAWLKKHFGKGVDKFIMFFAGLLGVALSIGLFIMLPNIPTKALRNAGWSLAAVNLLSGFIRILILIAYLILCGRQKDLRRTFQYHGSEHKAVYCFENDLDLTVENVQKFTTLHPRCGTSFLLITFIFSILFYSVLDQAVFALSGFDLGANYGARILSRLLMLPLVAGFSYEALRGLAKKDNAISRALRWPGMQLQRLTTRPPDDGMCEVAICSLKAALYGLPEGEVSREGWVIVRKEEKTGEATADAMPGGAEKAAEEDLRASDASA